ncbi:MAG TPA: Glu-tRNA(Gln) amidotransferase subunit GatD [Candidatus Nanoarchaeia archaeon]|nr:Glu-tRNA(Gln) amidotransferase subunit GatD [Candidatus Nanoarchaeia archaeon]
MVEIDFKAGDRVKLRLVTEEVEGQYVESSDAQIVLLKLESGYNIGIKKENILSSRKLPDKEEKIQEPRQQRQSKNLPKIAIVVTGGTIASKVSYKTGGVEPIENPQDFLDLYPEVEEIAEIKKLEMPFRMLSENMDSEHWINIAQTIKPLLEDSEIQGVILTHGTDTLHYTAAALSFFLGRLNKPVVLTYSQKSIDRASSDAKLNLISAVKMALSDCAEVMLVGHGTTNDDFCYALRGTKVKKMHSSKRAAFLPVNTEPLAKISKDKIEFLQKYNPRSDKKVEVDTSFTDKVALLKFYPGQDPSILDYYALSYKGIVIEGTGLGHVAASGANKSWLAALKKHIRNGLVVCMTSQTVFGRVDPYIYSAGREILDAGVIYLEDMLSETAFVKLGFVLGHAGWKVKAKEKMLQNMAYELNQVHSS